MKRLRFSAKARTDLTSIRTYTVEMWGTAQAKAYADTIKSRLRRLRDRPGLGVSCDEAVPELRRAMAGSHMVFYIEREDSILVVRVLHQRVDYRRHLQDLSEEGT